MNDAVNDRSDDFSSNESAVYILATLANNPPGSYIVTDRLFSTPKVFTINKDWYQSLIINIIYI